jgi:hypothetical protein
MLFGSSDYNGGSSENEFSIDYEESEDDNFIETNESDYYRVLD